jgi:dynein light intermediate chain 1
VYQVPSSVAPYPELVSLALNKSTLQDSLVLITLDWEKPWNFLHELRDWIQMLEGVLAKNGVLDQFEGVEGRERRTSVAAGAWLLAIAANYA